jgi:hypothetical protein
MPFQSLENKISGRLPSEESAQIITGHQYRHHSKRRVDPGPGDAGQFVETEKKSQCNGQWGVQAKKRGKTNEDPDGKTGCYMAGVGVQRKNFFELQLDLVSIYHRFLDWRQLYDHAGHFVN